MIQESKLLDLYVAQKLSTADIARRLGVSDSRVSYWLKKYNIKKRSISEAIYAKNHPGGDPFTFRLPKTENEFLLWGIGIGLYWGEGTKANKHAIRLGNSDPRLIKIFILFLETFFGIVRSDLRFHLHTFTDIDINDALSYWTAHLGIREKQFYKPTVTRTGALGTYKTKSKFGVVTVYYGNVKARNLLMSSLESEQFLPL